MSSALIINSANAVATSPPFYKFQYSFPTNVSFADKQISPTTVIVPYSWYNFSDTFNNNSFGVVWVDGSTATVNLGDGYYSAATLNLALDEVLINKTWYIIDSSGNFIYPLSIVENPTFYSLQINSLAVPDAAQAAVNGWTQPAGATWSWPLAATNPQIDVPAFSPNDYNTSFAISTGFNPGLYPPTQAGGVGYSVLSQNTPQINPITTVVMLCSLVNNRFAAQNNVTYAFSAQSVAFGDYINIEVPQQIWLECSRGSFQSFTLTFVDQTLRNPVPLQDPSITIMLSLKDTPLEERERPPDRR